MVPGQATLSRSARVVYENWVHSQRLHKNPTVPEMGLVHTWADKTRTSNTTRAEPQVGPPKESSTAKQRNSGETRGNRPSTILRAAAGACWRTGVHVCQPLGGLLRGGSGLGPKSRLQRGAGRQLGVGASRRLHGQEEATARARWKRTEGGRSGGFLLRGRQRDRESSGTGTGN